MKTTDWTKPIGSAPWYMVFTCPICKKKMANQVGTRAAHDKLRHPQQIQKPQ